MARSRSLTISLAAIGRGKVVRDLPVEDLLPPGERRVLGPNTPSSYNCRLLDGVAKGRPGYKTFRDTADTQVVQGLYQAVFDNGSAELIRADPDGLWRAGASTWDTILGTSYPGPFTGTDDDYWTFEMARRAGTGSTKNQLLMCNGVNEIVTYYPGVANGVEPVGAATITAAKAILGFFGRALFLNVLDTSTGSRRTTRVQRSIVGDSTDLTGLGSGFVDLDDTPYPIAAATVIGGRAVVYKGDVTGGAIVIGTPTGNVDNPHRWDTVNKESGIGILLPRTLTPLGRGVAFFVGHDALYIHDGARALQPIAPEITRDIMARINQNALQAAFAFYRPRTTEIVVAFPTGGSSVANETWTYNLREHRAYGPYEYNKSLTAAANYTPSGALTWDDLSGTWDTLPYSTWDSIGGQAGAQAVIYGTSTGETYEDDDAQIQDGSNNITCRWTSPAITAEGYAIFVPDKQTGQFVPQRLEAHDVLTLRDVTMRYEDGQGSWTPMVAYSTDGGTTWTDIADGATVAGDNTGKVLTTSYYTAAASSWFQFRVTSDNANMILHSLTVEFTYSGDERFEV